MVGFCGSFTTFSGWQLDVFNSWINEKHDHRDWLRDVCIYGLSVDLPDRPVGDRRLDQTVLHAFNIPRLLKFRHTSGLSYCTPYPIHSPPVANYPLWRDSPLNSDLLRHIPRLLSVA